MNVLSLYIDYETFEFRHYIERCRELTPEQFHQTFDIGHESVYGNIGHVIRNLEWWTDFMLGKPAGDRPKVPDEIDPLLERFDSAMAYLADNARAVMAENREDALFTRPDDDPPEGEPLTEMSFGGAIFHVLLHTTGHRGEIQHMLRRLGLTDLREGYYIDWEIMKRYGKT